MTTLKGASQNSGDFLYVLVENDDLSDIEKEYTELITAKKTEEEEKEKEKEEKDNEAKKKKKKIKAEAASEEQEDAMDTAADEIRKELDKWNSDEDKLIDLYNSICDDEKSAKKFKNLYKDKFKVDVIDDLDKALSSSELDKLTFKSGSKSKSKDKSGDSDEA